MQLVPLPPNRASFLEKKGEKIKRKLSESTGATIKLFKDRAEIEGESEQEWLASQVIKAVVLGFNEDEAFKLLSPNIFLEVLDLKDLTRSKKKIERFKSRIIGRRGTAKKRLEEITSTVFSIRGTKISLIGSFEAIKLAKEGVEKLIAGLPHNSVYKLLRQIKMKKGIK